MMKNIKKLLILIICFARMNLLLSTSNQFLDTTFGTDSSGIVEIDIGDASQINSIKIQSSDGKIIAAGSTLNPNKQFSISRTNTDGTIDLTFGTNGLTTTQIGSNASTAQISGIDLQLSGDIIAAGYYFDSGVATQIVIARYNTNGTLDTTFGTSGITTTLVGVGATASSVKIQADDSIVVSGTTVINGAPNILVARYTPLGILDTTFNPTGIGSGIPGVVTTLVGVSSSSSGVTIDGSRNIIIAGYSTDGMTSNKFTLARYTSTGLLDNTFGTNGIVKTVIGNNSSASSIAIDGSGNFLVAGLSDNNAALARYTSTGVLDKTFGTGGIVTTFVGTTNIWNSLAIQDDGGIVTGGLKTAIDGNADCLVARFLTTGALDQAFGKGGLIATSVSSQSNQINSIAIDANVKTVAGGFAINAKSLNSESALIRYTNGTTNSITITSPKSSTTGNVFSITGTSTGNNNQVKIFIDNVLFSTITTDGSGNWDGGQTSLSVGQHQVLVQLIVAAVVQASSAVTFTVGAIGGTGSTGSTGTRGVTGNTGFTGSTGNSGTTGASGQTGFTGSTGATGKTGFTGTTGFTGSTGFTGITGATGFDFTSVGYISAYDTTTQTTSGVANTFTDITFNTNGVMDTNATGWTHSTSSNTQNFTAGATGTYILAFEISAKPTNNAIVSVIVAKNGTEIPGSQSYFTGGSATNTAVISNNVIFNANTGDVIKLRVAATVVSVTLPAGGNGTVTSCRMSITRLV